MTPSQAAAAPAPALTRGQRRAGLAAAAVAAAVLALHFFLTWLYLAPSNPVKLAVWGELLAYMHPLFPQNWGLFAPTPIAENQVLLIRARLRDRATGAETMSNWVDITTPVMRQIHRQRIGPMSKLARPFSGISQTIVHLDPVAHEIRQRASQEVMAAYERSLPPEQRRRLRSENPADRVELPAIVHAALDTAARLSDEERAQRRLGFEMLYRLSSAFARRMFEPQYEVVAVNARYDQREFPRFSRRHEPNERGRVTLGQPLGWHPAYPDVTLP